MAEPLSANTPDSDDELRSARAIRLAYLAAQRAGPASEPLRILSPEELDAPIDSSADEPGPEDLPRRPHIVGYLLVKEISCGGQATIYLGTQESTGRSVAVKIIQGGATAISRHRVRFEREVRSLAALQHPHIVGILDRGRTEDGSFFLVMDFVDGSDFDDYVAQHIPPDPDGTRKLLELFIKIADALNEAHKLRIVHRDIKPSNIRIDSRNEPRILDFGLARQLGMEATDSRSMTVSGHIVGSIPWSSPEQAGGGEDVTPRSDVYSLGVVLYEMIAGEFPYFVKGSLREALDNIAHAKPARPTSVAGARRLGRRGDLDAIILKCLAKAPRDRYDSAGELATDLRDLLAGRRLPSVPRRHRPVKIVALFLLSLLTIGATAWHFIPASAPQVFKLPTMENSVGMRLIEVPAGELQMRAPLSETGEATKSPQRVKMGRYWISTTEVTQAQYLGVMGVNPAQEPNRGPTLPVQNVSWSEATNFCERLSAKEHRHYRLPTRAEWEYACLARSSESVGIAKLDQYAWHAENSGGVLHPVGAKLANAWGLYDMLGGVAEWCADDSLDSSNNGNPTASVLQLRVVRGGSSSKPAANCRATSEEKLNIDKRRPDIGFRIVLDVTD